MSSCIDAIDKLRSLGYSFALNEGRLKYTYAGKGNPPQNEITPLFEILKRHKGEILNDPYFLIEQTLEEINRQWEPATLEWMKANRPGAWAEIRRTEDEINKVTFEKHTETLKRALDHYRNLWGEMVQEMGRIHLKADSPETGTLPLFPKCLL